MYVEDPSGKSVPGAIIETWETDDKGESQTFCVRCLFSFYIILTMDHHMFFSHPIHQATTTLSKRSVPYLTVAVGCERTQRAALDSDTARSSPSRIPFLVMFVFALLDLDLTPLLMSICPFV